MGFGGIWNNSWKEFLDNIGSILLFLLLYLFVPLFLVGIIGGIAFFDVVGDVFSNGSTSTPNLSNIPSYAIPIGLLLLIVLIVVYVFVYSSFYGLSVKKIRYSWKDIAKTGKVSFWKFLGRGILLSLLLALLFLLLIIPGIIFSVYWMFSIYIWFNEPNLSFGESLKKSRILVKGRWWKTLGYSLLIGIMFFAAYILLSFVPFIGGLVSTVLGFYLIYFFRYMYIEYSKRK